MEEQEKDQAAAYIKLHEDVRKLILDIVMQELADRPYDHFASTLSTHVARHALPHALREELGNYRIVRKGETARSY